MKNIVSMITASDMKGLNKTIKTIQDIGTVNGIVWDVGCFDILYDAIYMVAYSKILKTMVVS